MKYSCFVAWFRWDFAVLAALGSKCSTSRAPNTTVPWSKHCADWTFCTPPKDTSAHLSLRFWDFYRNLSKPTLDVPHCPAKTSVQSLQMFAAQSTVVAVSIATNWSPVTIGLPSEWLSGTSVSWIELKNLSSRPILSITLFMLFIRIIPSSCYHFFFCRCVSVYHISYLYTYIYIRFDHIYNHIL